MHPAKHAPQWHHNGRDGVSNHRPPHCLFNRLFRRRSKKTSKLRVTGPCARNLPVTGEFCAQKASNAEKGFHLMTVSAEQFTTYMARVKFQSVSIFWKRSTRIWWFGLRSNPNYRQKAPVEWTPVYNQSFTLADKNHLLSPRGQILKWSPRSEVVLQNGNHRLVFITLNNVRLKWEYALWNPMNTPYFNRKTAKNVYRCLNRNKRYGLKHPFHDDAKIKYG